MNRSKKLARNLLVAVFSVSLAIPQTTILAAGVGAVTTNEVSEREQRNAELSMYVATQGMVLLENENNALPIAKNGKIALFGCGADATVKGGTGSGDVEQRDTVSVWESFQNAGYEITSESWLNTHYAAYTEAVQAELSRGSTTAPYIPDQEITDADLESAKAGTDTAVYVIARSSGESSDRSLEAGDYYLSDIEKNNLQKIASAFEHCIVVLNIGGIIDTSFMDEIEGIDALLLMSQAGMRGGDALLKVLNGEITPSGKLTDTWAKNYEDYPSSDVFSSNDGNVEQEDYVEGIYVGYRYFDTFNVEPAYEFGYGLSYTDFDITINDIAADADQVSVSVTVKNVGDTYSGKEVVQIYFSAPDGTLEKPYQELAAYGKTDELAPGESQSLTISFATTEMSSYDETSAAYLMEKGDYIIRVGNSSRNTTAAGIVRLDETVITEQLSNQLTPDKEITELSNKDAVSYSYDTEAEEISAATVIELSASSITPEDNASPYEEETVNVYVSDTTQEEYLSENLGYPLENPYSGPYEETVIRLEGDFSQSTLKDVYDGIISMEEFVSGLTVEEMANLVSGGNKLPDDEDAAASDFDDGTMIGAHANSVTGAAGETTGIYIQTKLIPNIVLADGPAGVNLTQQEESDGTIYYQYCTAWPIGTLRAQTWDSEIIESFGAAIGEEMKEFGVTLWLAPGMNIHRNPLCGRNFEYYSEDPYLTGSMAIAETTGVQSNPGVGVTLKHYAANSQENNRSAENNTLTERTFREIYLKGFEMAVKAASPMGIMTSYNLNNGVPAGDDYDLCTDLARGEWGFDGLIMTDWGGGQSQPTLSMHAGNDLIMPGSAAKNIAKEAFGDMEPVFGEDDVYPEINISIAYLSIGPRGSYETAWGEFVPSADGNVTIEKTVSTETFENAAREIVENGGIDPISISVKELIAQLGDAAEVTENNNGTTTVIYTGYYRENNISLGDLQKSVCHILNVVMASNQFANLFENVEAVSYTELHADDLKLYSSVEKSDILS